MQIYECDVTKSRSTYLPASLRACLHIVACTYDMSIGVPQRCSVLLKSRITPRLSLGLSLSLARSLALSLSLSLSRSLSLALSRARARSLALSLSICLFLSLSLSLPLSLSHDSTFSM